MQTAKQDVERMLQHLPREVLMKISNIIYMYWKRLNVDKTILPMVRVVVTNRRRNG